MHGSGNPDRPERADEQCKVAGAVMTVMMHGENVGRPVDPVLPRWWQTLDHWSFAAILLLFTLGLVLNLSASPPLAEKNGLPPFHYAFRQAIAGLVALTVMTALSMAEISFVRRFGTVLFGVAMVGLLLLPAFGTHFGKGAVRWFSFGFGSVQPSEFVKPGFAIFTAWLMASTLGENGPPGKLISIVFGMVIVLLLVLQPDYGQAALIIFAWCVMHFVSGGTIVPLVGIMVATVCLGVAAYNFSSHFEGRINTFLSSEVDPLTQIGYATKAIREGGVFGVGVGEGAVKWSLSDAHTDFIVAVAAEEFGLGMVFLLIGLLAFICVRSLYRLLLEEDLFVRVAGTGLAALFGIQAFVNLGVSVRLLPAKGMTMPLVSYGGSSLLAVGISLGLLLALTRKRLRPRGGEQVRAFP